MNFLDKTGLSYLWEKIKTKLSTKQDTLVSGTNIKTINGNSILGKGNINTKDIYSTNEQIIGTWIDGKPLYRKTITQVGLSQNTNLSVPHNIQNQETIWVDVANSFIFSSGRTITLPEVGYAGNLTDKTDVYVEGANVHLYSNGGWGSNWTFVVTLKYTKTTD